MPEVEHLAWLLDLSPAETTLLLGSAPTLAFGVVDPVAGRSPRPAPNVLLHDW